ncbi:LysR family transcriptional regulator [Castellaniella caeni]
MNTIMKNTLPGDLIDFCLVVEHGGIGAAARAANRPKSSISLAIRRLEEALALRLIERNRQSLQLTGQGRRLYQDVHPLLTRLDTVTGSYRDSGGEVSGELRIATPYEFGAHHLAPVVQRLLMKNPRLSATLDVQYAPIKELFAKGYDVAFVMANGQLSDVSAVSCRMFSLERALFAAPALLARHAPLQHPDDLRRMPLVTSSQDQFWHFTGPDQAPIDVPIGHCQFRSSNADVRRQAAVKGLGIIRVVGTFCAPFEAAGQLGRVLPDYACAPLRVYGVVNERRLMPTPVKALLDELESTTSRPDASQAD